MVVVKEIGKPKCEVITVWNPCFMWIQGSSTYNIDEFRKRLKEHAKVLEEEFGVKEIVVDWEKRRIYVDGREVWYLEYEYWA